MTISNISIKGGRLLREAIIRGTAIIRENTVIYHATGLSVHTSYPENAAEFLILITPIRRPDNITSPCLTIKCGIISLILDTFEYIYNVGLRIISESPT